MPRATKELTSPPKIHETTVPDGFAHHAGYLSPATQSLLLAEILAVIAAAPLYTPRMPRSGRPLSVAMTNCGPLGWLTDKTGGYRYEPSHPQTGLPWPPMPPILLNIWRDLAAYPHPPEACLINWYDANAKLGLHRDEDEQDFAAPVISISLGDAAWFRVGGLARRDPAHRLRLESGDVVIMGGRSRLIYHGIDRILAGTSDLIDQPGRFNLTLRRVTKCD